MSMIPLSSYTAAAILQSLLGIMFVKVINTCVFVNHFDLKLKLTATNSTFMNFLILSFGDMI